MSSSLILDLILCRVLWGWGLRGLGLTSVFPGVAGTASQSGGLTQTFVAPFVESLRWRCGQGCSFLGLRGKGPTLIGL